MIETAEEAKVFSNLSERFIHARINGKEYGFFAGLMMPIELAYMAALWAMTDAKHYARLLIQSGRLQEIAELNQQDTIFIEHKDNPNSERIVWYLQFKMRSVMKNWEPDHFDELVQSYQDQESVG